MVAPESFPISATRQIGEVLRRKKWVVLPSFGGDKGMQTCSQKLLEDKICVLPDSAVQTSEVRDEADWTS